MKRGDKFLRKDGGSIATCLFFSMRGAGAAGAPFRSGGSPTGLAGRLRRLRPSGGFPPPALCAEIVKPPGAFAPPPPGRPGAYAPEPAGRPGKALSGLRHILRSSSPGASPPVRPLSERACRPSAAIPGLSGLPRPALSRRTRQASALRLFRSGARPAPSAPLRPRRPCERLRRVRYLHLSFVLPSNTRFSRVTLRLRRVRYLRLSFILPSNTRFSPRLCHGFSSARRAGPRGVTRG